MKFQSCHQRPINRTNRGIETRIRAGMDLRLMQLSIEPIMELKQRRNAYLAAEAFYQLNQ